VDPASQFLLHPGANLIGYPFDGSAPFTETIPQDALEHVLVLAGEGEIAIPHPVIPDEWIGSLTELRGTHGYWFVMSDTTGFIFEPPALSRRGDAVQNIAVPDDWTFIPSSKQAFYFVESIELRHGVPSDADWLVTMNGEMVTGARQWGGRWTDVAVMGKDTQPATDAYFIKNDIPKFYLWSNDRQELIPLTGQITGWSDLGVSIIPKLSEGPMIPNHFAIHPAYPNPFNPNTQLKYELPVDSYVKITVYDMLGREVTQLRDGVVGSGYHSAVWHAENVSSGMYVIVFQAIPNEPGSFRTFVQKQKVMVLK